MQTDAWNPAQYERFRREREQPFWDLVGLLRRDNVRRVADLGCGTGALTVQLHHELQADETIGVDSSPAMLARAASLAAQGVRFMRADIETWQPDEPVDIVFSNAALHWVQNHEELFPQLVLMLSPGGQLGVQMPANFDHPSHTVAAAVAQEEPFASATGGYVREAPVLAPDRYSVLLHQLNFAEQHVRMQVYGHLLDSTDAVVEWVRGTLLTDYEARMPAAMYEQFLGRYRDRLLHALGDERPYFYAFKRILLWAQLPQPA